MQRGLRSRVHFRKPEGRSAAGGERRRTGTAVWRDARKVGGRTHGREFTAGGGLEKTYKLPPACGGWQGLRAWGGYFEQRRSAFGSPAVLPQRSGLNRSWAAPRERSGDSPPSYVRRRNDVRTYVGGRGLKRLSIHNHQCHDSLHGARAMLACHVPDREPQTTRQTHDRLW